MNALTRRAWLRGALALLSGGCAVIAKPTPTPAPLADITVPIAPPPGERFYVLVFASQSTPKRPAYSHSFAVVVRTAECEPGTRTVLEHHTISWMPATLVIRTFSLHPEPGANLSLDQSMQFALRTDQRISEWGPYECGPRFFRRFVVQKEFLESGAVGYQCIDNIGEAGLRGDGCDCIHAITDMDTGFSRAEYPLIWYGEDASANIVRQLHERDWLHRPEVTYDWLNEPLGLSAYPIIHRAYRRRLLAVPLSRVT